MESLMESLMEFLMEDMEDSLEAPLDTSEEDILEEESEVDTLEESAVDISKLRGRHDGYVGRTEDAVNELYNWIFIELFIIYKCMFNWMWMSSCK